MTARSVDRSSLLPRLDTRARDLGPPLDLVVPAFAGRETDITHHQHEDDVEHDEREHDRCALERISDRYCDLADVFADRVHGCTGGPNSCQPSSRNRMN